MNNLFMHKEEWPMSIQQEIVKKLNRINLMQYQDISSFIVDV